MTGGHTWFCFVLFSGGICHLSPWAEPRSSTNKNFDGGENETSKLLEVVQTQSDRKKKRVKGCEVHI